MKKNLIKVLMATGICASLALSPMMVFANEKGVASTEFTSERESYIQPRVNWSGSAYLVKD